MRAANVAAVAALLLGAAAAEAQLPRERAVIRRSEWNPPESRGHVHHPEPAGPRHFDPHDHAHGGVGGTGSPYGYSYAPFPYPYGYDYGFGYEGVYGPGLSYYRGPAPFSGINPPVYVFPPVGYGFGYGGYGFGGYGYGSAWYPVGPDPLNNRLLQEQYDSDWARLSAELADRALKNVDDPRPGTTAVPVPSTPEAKLKSLRYQAQGDEAFANQDYAKALDRYKAAASAAKDDGRAYFKAGYAFVALGRFASAIEYFKRGLAVEPALAAIGPTPDELYGDHQLAWTAHLGRVTRWVREDVRDAQRVFLLGLLLHFDGDTRAREFLEKAWQLSGGTEAAVVTLLSPPKVEGVRVVEPASDGELATGGAGEGVTEGPVLGQAPPSDGAAPSDRPAPHDDDDLDLPEIPEPPAAASPPAGRPAGQEPLFPLPSEQGRTGDAPAAPPLPPE